MGARTERDAAPATVANCVNILSLMLAAAIRAQLLAVTPCSGLTLPSVRRSEDVIRALTREEFAGKLLPAVPVEHRPIVSTAAGWSVVGECAGLPWDAIDLDGAELRVRRLRWSCLDGWELRPCPKTRAGRRTVPVPDFVVDLLKVHQLRRDPRAELVFGTRVGTPLRRSTFRRVWVSAVELSGLPPSLRFHDLRHSYATWLISDGAPVNVVSRLLGHEQITTTLNRYTHDARDYADLRVRGVFSGLSADDGGQVIVSGGSWETEAQVAAGQPS
jgi:integrase